MNFLTVLLSIEIPLPKLLKSVTIILDGYLPANKTTNTKTEPCGLSPNNNKTLPTSDSYEHSSATPTEASTSAMVTDISVNEGSTPVSVVVVPIPKIPKSGRPVSCCYIRA